jgi:N-sulfoglucosamine sulfohydrolase
MATPNIVLFISHDTGRFLSPYGVRSVHTPSYERLAREGVTFDNAFCTSPLCCPSRASCVTGLHAHQHGVMGLTAPALGGWDLAPGVAHAADHFGAAGYETVLCGFEHETPHWRDHGFSRSISGPGGWFNGGGDTRNHAAELGRFLAGRDRSRPFYVQIGSHETHRDWEKYETPPDESLGLTIPHRLLDTPEVRGEVAAMQGAVRRLDECAGAILAAIDDAGLRDSTFVVFTTDHGIDFPNYKGTLFDGGIETFLFMRFPGGGLPAGARVRTPVSQLDILPTLLDAAGVGCPGHLAGASLLGDLRAGGEPRRGAIFAGKTYHDSYDPSRCVRTATHKYIRHFEVNIFQDLRLATETRRHFLREPWLRGGDEELYDLITDPGETRNLATEAASAPVLAELRRRLLAQMQATSDPLLRGPVPSPHYSRRLREFMEGR